MNHGWIDIYVEANPHCPEGCTLRYKAESLPEPVLSVLPGYGVDDWYTPWAYFANGRTQAAIAVTVEDSGGGAAKLVYGGDWGLKLLPDKGHGPVVYEPYLLLSVQDVVINTL